MNRIPELVMIADADANVRELVGHFVTEAGYRVSYATDGYEALDSARKSPPIVILAAEERARQAGADGFIQKPLEKNRILKIIKTATNNRSFSHE